MAASSRRWATACWSSSAAPSRRCARQSSCSAAWSSATPASPAERRQAFRIGLHLGDIIVSDEDVFGDTVNVASRLEGLAEPGSIVLSASVYEQVRDKLALPFRAQGSRTLKNIDRPIQVYSLDAAAVADGATPPRTTAPVRRLTLAGAAVAAGAGHRRRRSPAVVRPRTARQGAWRVTRPPAESGLSVAVLMFTNQSGDAAQDYFSDGLTEDITRALGRFKELTVISYNAVLPFRNKELPLAEIGRALNARYLVSGSVRRMGQRVRVTVQLSDATNGTQLWSEQYDDELSDIFAVQERIARRVAGTLATSLQQIALQQSLRKPTDNLDAYDMLLRARALGARCRRATANRMAREMLERVTQMAPGYADAYAELADIYFQRAAFGWSEFAQQDVETAIRLAQKALEIDRGLRAGPQRAGARLYRAVLKYDLGLAESERALQLNPSDAEVMLARAAVLLWTGRIDESIAAAEAAMRLNVSIGPEAALNLGLAYLLATPLRRRREAAGGGAHPLSDLSAARFPARRRLCRARPRRRCAGGRGAGPSSRTRTSTWQASARASRTRRCSAASRKACARRA